MSTIAAIIAVNTQDVGSASLGTIRTSNPGESTNETGRPNASATLRGTIRTAAAVQPTALHDAMRSAR